MIKETIIVGLSIGLLSLPFPCFAGKRKVNALEGVADVDMAIGAFGSLTLKPPKDTPASPSGGAAPKRVKATSLRSRRALGRTLGREERREDVHPTTPRGENAEPALAVRTFINMERGVDPGWRTLPDIFSPSSYLQDTSMTDAIASSESVLDL